ncbi:pyrimidine dimer DNA glycosylase/endonuclease V [Leucobacter triazinivorans]|uniref:Pyrimidine dimer DNA glycosylase n=1 Tax=Leucobacter triazinivorans TaxID=1784719 RepID=A0A4P6KCS5_9MICO|nr:pyrimidine dimer DNA glycosylase/endonuclease V [Leucobacter triazinivorans]QBE48165.1 pyrimidine dimer DNA glycosylase [Leucobacter triazinivorans]
MRIWSLHPSHLDRMGLVACWRETLLAQAVLAGRTKGYRNHPQLDRFRAQPEPLDAVGAYLSAVANEARARGYRFDASRILRAPGTAAVADDSPAAGTPAGAAQGAVTRARVADPGESAHASGDGAGAAPVSGRGASHPSAAATIPVTRGQLDFEWAHLGRKLRERSPEQAVRWEAETPTAHPLFRVVPGDIESWERP